jgi:hypothetical protein
MLRTRTIRKTTKKTSPLSLDTTPLPNNVEVPVVVPIVVEINKEMTTESMLSALHSAESKTAAQRPWLRLERGVRMKLLRSFTDKKADLTSAERSELLQTLVDALDKRLLNSKSQITYSSETGEISEINALKITKSSSGKLLFKIDSPSKATKKAKRHSGSDDE